MGSFKECGFYAWLNIFPDDTIVGESFSGDSCPIANYAKYEGYHDVTVVGGLMSADTPLLHFPVIHRGEWIERVVKATDKGGSSMEGGMDINAGELRKRLGIQRSESWLFS